MTPEDLPPRWAWEPIVRAELADWPDPQIWTAGEEALLVSFAGRRGPGAIGLGDPAVLASLVPRLPAREYVVMSLERGTWELLEPHVRARFRLPVVSDWDWMYTTAEPEPVPGEAGVTELDLEADGEELQTLQRRVLPATRFRADRPGSRWFGWRDAGGTLRGLAGAAGWGGTQVHMGSIGTDPSYRRRGVASALTAAVTRAGLRDAGLASLGVYPENTAATHVYERLGFRVGFRSHSRHPS